jgi:flagellar basal body-associated protein FliL
LVGRNHWVLLEVGTGFVVVVVLVVVLLLVVLVVVVVMGSGWPTEEGTNSLSVR